MWNVNFDFVFLENGSQKIQKRDENALAKALDTIMEVSGSSIYSGNQLTSLLLFIDVGTIFMVYFLSHVFSEWFSFRDSCQIVACTGSAPFFYVLWQSHDFQVHISLKYRQLNNIYRKCSMFLLHFVLIQCITVFNLSFLCIQYFQQLQKNNYLSY